MDKSDSSTTQNSEQPTVRHEIIVELMCGSQLLITGHPSLDDAKQYVGGMCIKHGVDFWPHAYFNWVN